MKMVLQGNVEHSVCVTYLKGVGYAIRILVNGEVNQEEIAPNRSAIGPVIKQLLRFEDKCGNISGMASGSRHRLK